MLKTEDIIHNHIKRHIVGLLMKNPQLKYSELMPGETDNVLFNYHLQHLVKNGIINKGENHYTLSQDGISLTSNITYEGLYFPKFTCRYKLYLVEGEKVLLQHRQRTPWYGDITALSSKLVYGAEVEARANLRMKQKTGVETEVKWLGTIRTLAYNTERDLLDDSIYFVCYANSYKGEVAAADDNGDPLKWYTFEEAMELEAKNRGTGEKSLEVLKRLQTKNFNTFAFEEVVIVEKT